MAPTNDFVSFCPTDTGTNLLEQSAYLADPQLPIGNQPGVARLQLVNKALRQATYIASCVAQFLANTTGNNVLDDATQSEVLTTMTAAFKTSPVVQVFTASGTYTVPANALYLRVRAVGGGGGGAGGNVGGTIGGAGGTGGNTSFGGTLVVANGGGGGVPTSTAPNAGGSSSLTGATGLSLVAGTGGGGEVTTVNITLIGALGAASPFGGAGGSGISTGGLAASPNTGSGGGGGVPTGGTAGQSGGGGCAGGFADALVTGTLSATYAVVIGAAGAAGTAGTSGLAGGAGGSGLVEVTAYFQ